MEKVTAAPRPRLYSTGDLAARWGVTAATIQNWILRSGVHHARVGKSIVVFEDDLPVLEAYAQRKPWLRGSPDAARGIVA